MASTTSDYDTGRATSTFTDSSLDCAICLCPLDDDGESGSDDVSDRASSTITLRCGHRWHLRCIEEQLQHAQPDTSRRILFSGCRCAKCGLFCDHPALRHLTRRTDTLRNRVDELITDQLSVDAASAWHSADKRERKKLIDEGRRSYAFYLCASCNEPYFGGTVDCADQSQGELPAGEGDRLCPACSPSSQLACRDPIRHRGYHVWKCRYCCNASSHICYGTVHFCDRCHDRNSDRVREQGRRYGSRVNASSGPPPLEAIKCPGGNACPYPKLEGQDHHLNGSACRCEQVYYCAWCRSMPLSARHGNNVILEEGSRNFISNPSGKFGTRHWQQLNPQMSWGVERSELSVDGTVRTNFVSSFQWCVMAQSVPLHRLVFDPSSVRIEVSAMYMARTDCPSVFRMEAILLDSTRQREIRRRSTAALVAPADFWERASIVFEPTGGAHHVVMVVYGKDGSFWRGQFGSKVANCSVRILCAEDELEQIVIPDGERGGGNQRDGVVANRARQRREIMQQDPIDWVRSHVFDILLPFALIVFCWLMSPK
mmetsp:Transcript_30436/g.67445  ORF Transcript_30436/g.67445 Transcript_30436/m.67445 type:complete len:542 (-) Transcript_30436:780-2405(-)